MRQVLYLAGLSILLCGACTPEAPEKPNILLIITDDQSFPHAGAYGDATVQTPAFDRIAAEGVLFTHCFCPASQCSPSRAALLTGLNIWQLEEAGTHASLFPVKFPVYTEVLEAEGYHVGYTGKPWAPGNWKAGGRKKNPAGTAYNEKTLEPPSANISGCDYAANFLEFLNAKPEEAPFCFWMGGHEPHRNYEWASGLEAGKTLSSLNAPGYLPDVDSVRSDLLDYKVEIEWHDQQVAKVLDILDEQGELDNTFIILTSDNGMPFPRAKANLYDAGTRIPLAIRYGRHLRQGQIVDELVSLVDIAPTLYELTGIPDPGESAGISLMGLLLGSKDKGPGHHRNYVLMGKERHNHARPDNVGYPSRAIHTRDFLYIRNFRPGRWPLGNPPYYFCHTTMINPTKQFILSHMKDKTYVPYYDLIYNKRPEEELYDVKNDPDCLHNLAMEEAYLPKKTALRSMMDSALQAQNDPRMSGMGDLFESYPYYQKIRTQFPGFQEYGAYNPAYIPGHPDYRKNQKNE